MAYSPQTWTDGTDGGTPLSAARLTHIETGVQAAATTADAALTPAAAAAAYVPLTAEGSASGVATLDGSGHVPVGQLRGNLDPLYATLAAQTHDAPGLGLFFPEAHGGATIAGINAAAAAAAAAGGGTVSLTAANYTDDGTAHTVTVAANKVRIKGFPGCTVTTASATLHLFDLGDNVTLFNELSIEDLNITSSVVRSAGDFIRVRKCFDVNLTRLRLTNHYLGIEILDGQSVRITDVVGQNPVAGGPGLISADAPTGAGLNLYLTRVATDAPNGAQPSRGMSVKGWDGIFMTDTQFNHSGTGLCIEPVGGQSFTHLFASNCSFDTNSNDGFLSRNTGGTIERLWFSNCWFGSNGNDGCVIDGPALGVTLIAPKCCANGQFGLSIVNAGGVDVVDPLISGNSTSSSGTYDGVLIGAGISEVKIVGGDIRPLAGFANSQQRAITIAAGAGDHLQFIGVNVFGNVVGSISNAATGSNNKIQSCIGYNPVGVLGPPAVPASTVAYTNAYALDAEVNVNGGTVTVVAIGGAATGRTSGPFRVPAGQTITLTYSVAPTWTWFGD